MFIKWLEKCLVLTTVLTSIGATASNTCDNASAGTNWHLMYGNEILTLYEPDNASGPPELSAQISWSVSPETLYQIIWDYKRFHENIPHVEESSVLLVSGAHKWIYQQLSFPGPIQDRHYVLESTNFNSRPDQHLYRVEWQLSDRFPLPANQLVRPSAFSGCWIILPGPAGGLNAMYHIQLDPAGHVPRWIARTGMRHYVKQLMEHLFKLVQAPTANNKSD